MARVLDKELGPGNYKSALLAGRELANGIYFAQVVIGEKTEVIAIYYDMNFMNESSGHSYDQSLIKPLLKINQTGDRNRTKSKRHPYSRAASPTLVLVSATSGGSSGCSSSAGAPTAEQSLGKAAVVDGIAVVVVSASLDVGVVPVSPPQAASNTVTTRKMGARFMGSSPQAPPPNPQAYAAGNPAASARSQHRIRQPHRLLSQCYEMSPEDGEVEGPSDL